MKQVCMTLIASLTAFLDHSAWAANQLPERFTAIATRNAFRLSPPKLLDVEAPSQPNRPKVSFQGTTTILGGAVALLTIEPASKPAGSFETSCVLAQGESRFEVVVSEIDVKAGTVRLSNLGSEQKLALKR